MEKNPRQLPVLLLDGVVLFPGVVGPVEIDEAARGAVEAALSDDGQRRLAVVTRRPDESLQGVIATEADILKIVEPSEAPAHVILRGKQRVRILEMGQKEDV